MRYIKKQAEPPEFSDWKAQGNEGWKPYWNSKGTNFRNPQKKRVHESLLKEQGYICCYCQRRIDLNNSHIEHFKPKDEDCYPELSLDYSNFLASCQKEKEKKKEFTALSEQTQESQIIDNQSKVKDNQKVEEIPIHCGHLKGNWYNEKLTVSPLIENCEEFFRYTESGEILPSDDLFKKEAAKTTIEKLGLNLNKLVEARSGFIQGVLGEEDLTQQEIDNLLIAYNQVNENGQYEPFCSAVIYVLGQYKLLAELNSKNQHIK